MAANWTPRTQAQEEVVERLGKQSGGVLARSLDDGASEVLAVERGAYKRYRVRADGTGLLVESQPRGWRWPLSDVLGWAAVVLLFVITILLFVLARTSVVDAGWWTAIPFVLGMILFAAVVLDPSPYRLNASWRASLGVGSRRLARALGPDTRRRSAARSTRRVALPPDRDTGLVILIGRQTLSR